MYNTVQIIETPKGPMDPTPKISVVADGKEFSEVRRERGGWLIADIPDEEAGSREVRGRGIRDLRIRAGVV